MSQRRTKGAGAFERSASAIAATFKALSDPTRVRIVAAILDEERCVHDLCQELDLEQSTVSHQLRLLRNQDVVRYRKQGRHVYYALDDEHVRKMLEMAIDHVGHGSKRGRR